MTEINFGSTYRIPVSQPGINKAKKIGLKSLVDSYGGLVGTGNTGYARVSIPNEKDTKFLQKLRSLGYKIYQVFEGEKISKKDLDDYIKKALASNEYNQKGKQKARHVNRKIRLEYQDYESDKRVKAQQVASEIKPAAPKDPIQKEYMFDNWEKDTKKAEQDQIRKTESYKNVVKKYGEEAAEAMFFFTRKMV